MAIKIVIFCVIQVHRLVVTDVHDKVIGILSLSDLLMYLVLRPCGKLILLLVYPFCMLCTVLVCINFYSEVFDSQNAQ